MNPNSRDARLLLEKYLEGNCTPEEILLLHSWYDQLPDAEAKNSAQDQGGLGDQQILEEKLRQATWNQIKQVENPVRRINLRVLAAACLIGVLLCSAILLFSNKRTHLLYGKASVVQEVNNTMPGVSKLVLPDGSQVWLNAHSHLSWKNDFASGNRTVELDGEGYFEVAKDADHPFRVQSRNFVTRVLGTSFNIECYSAENRVRVALVRGSVQVLFTDNRVAPVLLKPGQIAMLGEGNAAFQVERGDVGAYASWVSGGFVLRNVPLETALQRLCYKYGYTIHENFDRDRQKPISVSFDKGSFEEILNSILYINHLTYSIRDSVITVR